MSSIADLSLVEVAQRIRDAQTTSVEATEACIERAETLGKSLNCFISLDADAAREQAQRADARAAAGESLGPLHGVPLAHKDMYYRAGVVTSCGSKIRQDFRPTVTATVLERLEEAGAINLGGLNMAEFAFGPTGHNHHFGAARNPWNPAHITGGSSSGSGAATAARIVFGALGSDTGGSVRLPAAACGLVGLKPTQTRVSRYGVMGLSFSLDNVGPLTRTVADCARMTDVITGHDPRDPTSSRQPAPGCEAATQAPSVAGLRLGIPDSYYYDRLDEGVREALEASISALESLGATRVSVPVPDQDHLCALANIIQASEAATLHGAWLRERPGDYGPQVRARIESGLGYNATAYLSAVQSRPRLIRRFVETVFARCDVLHLPGIPCRLPTIAASDVGDSDGFAEVLSDISHCTRPISYLALPSLAVPIGFSEDQLPVSCQLVGRPFAEAQLFAIAAAYEAATGWPQHAPALGQQD